MEMAETVSATSLFQAVHLAAVPRRLGDASAAWYLRVTSRGTISVE
jgi:hypothetical protein